MEHTPQEPPRSAQCPQYLQFLHARQLAAPVQVASTAASAAGTETLLHIGVTPVGACADMATARTAKSEKRKLRL